MRIGIDIDNVISNFNEELLKEFQIHDKELRDTGIINKDIYITRGMFDWSPEELNEFYHNNIERIAKSLNVIDTVFIISGRDNGEYREPYKMTTEWLEKFSIEYDRLILTNA